MRNGMAVLLLASLFAAPGRTAGAGELSAPQKRGLEKSVKQFIKEKSEGGAFILHDEKLDKDWRLKLVRLRLDAVSQISEKLFSVPGDFKQTVGRKSLGIDFLVNKTDEGWAVRQAVINQVDAAARAAVQTRPSESLRPAQPAAVSYTCPMHPDVVSDKPGKCPKCGMELQRR